MTPEGAGGPPRRRRAPRSRWWFDRRWWVVGLLFLVAVTPVVVEAIHRHQQPWALESDEATIAVRSRDVLQGHVPLVGQMSAGNEALDDPTLFHPGPVGFYVLAPFSLGSTPHTAHIVAMALAMAIAAATLVAAMGVLGGPRLAGASTVVVALILWGLGSDAVGSTWNPYFVVVPFAAFLALSVATAAGHVRLLPLVLAAASVVMQGHLAYLGLVGMVAGWVAIVAIWTQVRERGSGAALKLAAVSGFVVLLLWSAPLYQELTGEPGNLSQIFRLALGGEGDPVGGAGVGELGRIMGLPLVGLEPRPDMIRVLPPLSIATGLRAVVPFASAAALMVLAWQRRDRLAIGAVATVGVIWVGAVLTVMRVPRNQGLVYQYYALWLWPAAAVTWLVLGWSAARLFKLGPWLDERLPAGPSDQRVRRGIVVGIAALALVVVGMLPRPGAWEPWVANRVLALSVAPVAADAILIQEGAVTTARIHMSGPTPFLSTASALLAELEYRGIDVTMAPGVELVAWPWGEHRRDTGADVDVELWIVSGEAPPLPDGATLVAAAPTLGASEQERLAELSDTLRRDIEREGVQRGPFSPTSQQRQDIAAARADPVAALTDGTVAGLASQGVIRPPGGDLHAIHTYDRLSMMAGEGEVQIYVVPGQRS